MQKWEYKLVLMVRDDKPCPEDQVPLVAAAWKMRMKDGRCKEINPMEYINKLGAQGWELVSVVAESDNMGGLVQNRVVNGRGYSPSVDFAGFTTSEKLYFKRPRP